jgi:tellurite resistance protein
MSGPAHAQTDPAHEVPISHALIYTMVMVSAADGEMTDVEMELIGDIVRHLPVFRGFELNELTAVARDCGHHLQHKDGMHHVFHIIKASLPERLRETAYAVACDVAASDSSVSPAEIRFLELLRHELDLDRLHAAAIERGARARYLTT